MKQMDKCLRQVELGAKNKDEIHSINSPVPYLQNNPLNWNSAVMNHLAGAV